MDSLNYIGMNILKKISDKYLTWGWMDESSGNKISPIGIIRPLPKIRKKILIIKNFY